MRWETLDYIVRSATDWLFRVRKPESLIFRGAVLVLVLMHGTNWVVKYTGPIFDKQGSLEVGTIGYVPPAILVAITIICLLLMAASAIWAVVRYKHDRSADSAKKVFVIEGRGLRDDDGSPLKAEVPSSIVGKRMDYLLDLRQHKDGVVVDPDSLLLVVAAMKTWLHQAQGGNERNDLTTVYGGLTAVPFTFLCGLLLDDEGDVIVMDWDRVDSRWRTLDSADDGDRFEIDGLDKIGNEKEVVLAISASYMVKDDDLATTFSHPIVRMTLPSMQSSHWSQVKQSNLADQFLGVLKQIDGKEVERIHLVLAAQNSVVFNLARRYDKRNLPRLTVYQYERAQDSRYPWGVEMPVAGKALAAIAVP